ncbi:hypothetical protein EX30DRAFT_55163 [Ascodesmis nigricans]|uniref:C2H2-type domain-containing protein n=1 Tax=Ascodesmis nigricans TaxID=341454 RepID=A0A4S2MVF4_9PEZI|nr:hypothetical protein EX30DRAFT_55163 [Ascodesmis nigricans]
MTIQTAQSQAAHKKGSVAQEKKYKCAYCARAFSRSEHRSRHERSHTKERPFGCHKCRSTFVRRDLLLRHDRTVHAKDGGIPLHSEVKRRSKTASSAGPLKPTINIEPATYEELEGNSDGMVDLERAAALMTELRQAAAMVDQQQEDGREKSRRSMSSGPEYESGMFASGAIHVQNMSTYDPPTPSSTSGADLPSHTPTSHCAQDWNSNTLQLPVGIYPTSMERSFSAEPTPSYVGSPNPYMHGPPSPSPLASSPASSLPTPPSVQSESEREVVYENIAKIDEECAVVNKFRLPRRSALNRYLAAYFNLFHHHLPFLHCPSFLPGSVAPPLFLAVLSVGALYTFEREQAHALHLSSKALVHNYLTRNTELNARNCPLWAAQTLLLNSIFASWSGDLKGVESAMAVRPLLVNMVIGGRYELQLKTERRGEDNEPITKQDWLRDEGCKRTYFAIEVFFGMLTLTYNLPPPLESNEFDAITLPCSESLWNLDLSDDQTLRESLANEATPTYADARNRLFHGEPPQYSVFASRIMINTLFLTVWDVKQNPQALEDDESKYRETLRVALDTWHRALDLCTPESMIVPLTQAPQKGHPLIFNALAMYRCAAARLEVDLFAIQEAVQHHSPEDVASAMSTRLIHRSDAMTKVIQLCFECFQIPALMGIRWVARTSALNWSVEHPLCGFDLMIILSLWLQKLEEEADEIPPTEEEHAMLAKIRHLFDDDSVEMFGSRLSAAVARVWGGMIDEVVVWGITKLLGESFKIHSHTLALNDDAGMTLSSSSSPSPAPDTDMDSDMD